MPSYSAYLGLLVAMATTDAATWTHTYLPYGDDAGPFGPQPQGYERDDPKRQHLYLLQTESAEPTPVYFFAHSNGARASSMLPEQLDEFASAGYSVISWESVSYLTTEEDVHTCWDDFELVWDWFQANAAAYNFDPNSAIIGGRSRGSLCSWPMAHSAKPEILGAYMYNALPNSAWGPEASWVSAVTAESPPMYLVYGPECEKPITQDCLPSPAPGDGHNPKNGQTIVDRYEEVGLASEITLTDGLTNDNIPIFQLFPGFAASLESPGQDTAMTLSLLPSSTEHGGRCLDGTMAGYAHALNLLA